MSCTYVSIFKSSVERNLRFFAVVENVMTLCPNEREVQLQFFVHLFGHIRRHSVYSSFNCNLFSIIQYFTSEMHIFMEDIYRVYIQGEPKVGLQLPLRHFTFIDNYIVGQRYGNNVRCLVFKYNVCKKMCNKCKMSKC